MSTSTLSFTTLMPSFVPAESALPTSALAARKDARAMEQEQSRREDEELVARAQTGDVAAFDSLIVKYSPPLYALVYHMT